MLLLGHSILFSYLIKKATTTIDVVLVTSAFMTPNVQQLSEVHMGHR